MQRGLWVVAVLSVAGTEITPAAELADGLFTQAEWEMIRALSPLPALPPEPTNRYADDPAAAALGQKLFFEPEYAGPIITGDDGSNGGLGAVGEAGKVSCASCHEGPWMIDLHTRPPSASLGTDWVPRNAGSTINIAFYEWFENNGFREALWTESMVDPELDFVQNGNRLKLAHVIYEDYRDEYNAVFDRPLPAALDAAHAEAHRFPPEGKPGDPAWENMAADDREAVNWIFVNFGKAVAAYMRQLVSRDAPFDKYVAGDRNAISERAKQGLKLFISKAQCVACHNTPFFSDNGFHNIGMRPEGAHIDADGKGRYDVIENLLGNPFNVAGAYSDDPDTGKLRGLAQNADDIGRWRTKSLRQVAKTPPYMRYGQFATLREVIDFYDIGGHADGFHGTKSPLMRPLGLTEREKEQLVAFLETLTGAQVPARLLEDTSVP
jgi:cytochrome c peroxidase